MNWKIHSTPLGVKDLPWKTPCDHIESVAPLRGAGKSNLEKIIRIPSAHALGYRSEGSLKRLCLSQKSLAHGTINDTSRKICSPRRQPWENGVPIVYYFQPRLRGERSNAIVRGAQE
jgi:hypothetical protein